MPKYKKKRKHYKPINKKSQYIDDSSDILMRSGRKKKVGELDTPKLIKGKKKQNAVKFKVVSVTVVVLVVLAIILKLIFPVGIFETFKHFFSTLGIGEFPLEISGNEVVDVSVEGNSYFVLTNTNVYSITNSGKIINSFSHGFKEPKIKTSNTRALVYGQGKEKYSVFIGEEKKISEKTDYGICCCDISDSGVFAIATFSKSYSSCVTVYNADGEQIFSWNCANGYINSVALSRNGKRMAVSTLNSSGGEKSSKLYFFNFKNTDSEKTVEYNNKFIYDLVPQNSGVFVICGNSYDFIDWNDKKTVSENTEFNIKLFRSNSYGSVAVLDRNSNNYDNKICYISKKGEKANNFTFSGVINDVSLYKNHIFVNSDSTVYIYDIDGKSIGKINCGYMGRRIIPVGSNKVCVVFDDTVNVFELKE